MNAGQPNTSPQRLSGAALERVRTLLAGRVRRAGAHIPPEWAFQCEAAEPQAFPGGWQVRVRTWRHWSDAAVHFDAESGETLYRCVDRLADPPTDAQMSLDAALRAAQAAMTIPDGARLTGFRHEAFAAERNVARLEWEHWHDGMRVEGDRLLALIHPETGRLIAFRRKWRSVSPAASR
jgi:hypothetical protein